MKEKTVKVPIIGTINSETEEVTYYKEPKHMRDGREKSKKLDTETIYKMLNGKKNIANQTLIFYS